MNSQGAEGSTSSSASEDTSNHPNHSMDLSDSECPVCFDKMEAPRTLPCGHNVCHGCFEMWANLSNNCPFCKRPMEDLQTVLTRTLKNLQDHLQSSIDSLNKLKTIRSHISDDPRTGIISRQISKVSDLANEIGIRVDDGSADFATIHVMPDSNLNELLSMMFANIQPNNTNIRVNEPTTRAPPPQTPTPTPAPAPSPQQLPQQSQPVPPVTGNGIPGFPSDIFGALQMPSIFGVPQFDTTTTIRRQIHIRSPQRPSEAQPQTSQTQQPQMPNLANLMNGQNFDNLFSSLSSLLQPNNGGNPSTSPNSNAPPNGNSDTSSA